MVRSIAQPQTTDPMARALARGVAAGLSVYRVSGRADLRFVTSQSEPGLGYLVTIKPGLGAACSCADGASGQACAHGDVALADWQASESARRLKPVTPLADDAELSTWGWVALGQADNGYQQQVERGVILTPEEVRRWRVIQHLWMAKRWPDDGDDSTSRRPA